MYNIGKDFHAKNEYIRGQWVTLSNSSHSAEELSFGAIAKYIYLAGGNARHDKSYKIDRESKRT